MLSQLWPYQLDHEYSLQLQKKDRSTNLGLETSENKTPCEQVDYLTTKLHKQKQWEKQLTDLHNKESSMGFERDNLNIKLENQLKEPESQLAECESLQQCQRELERERAQGVE